MSKPAHKSGTAGQWINPDMPRGVISDQAKKLSDVIDRVQKSEELHEQYATVWHEGSNSFYHAKLLRKMSNEEVQQESDGTCT